MSRTSDEFDPDRVLMRRRDLTVPGGLYEMEPHVLSGGRRWANGPQTLRDIVDGSAAFSDLPFLVLDDTTVTYSDHHAGVCALAHDLRDLGVRRGDRVAIAMRNLPEFSMAMFAAVSIGAIATPLNAWWTASELSVVLDDAMPRVVLADGPRLERVLAARTRAEFDVIDIEGDTTRSNIRFDWVAATAGPSRMLPATELSPDDPATLFYTSGTSGRPKGVVGSHLNMASSLLGRAFYRDLDHDGPPAGLAPTVPSRALLTVPLFHVTGAHAYLLGALATGSMLVLMHRWTPRGALDLIERHSITTVGGVPHVAAQLLDEVERVGVAPTTLRNLNVGGAPCPPSLVARAARLLPDVSFGNGYGMTETSSVAIYNFGRSVRRHPEAIGWLNPIMDAVVVGPTAQRAERGSGELFLRGANVALGYWNGEDRPLEPLGPDGWLATGDLATIHPDGLIELVGRSKDVIMRGGENIQPAEVESVLASHDAVAEAAVVGVPHPTLGQEVHAIVVRREGADLDARSLVEHLTSQLARYKVPTTIWERRGALPRSPQGKVQRAALLELLSDFDQLYPPL